jgi:clan AA aspartic protease
MTKIKLTNPFDGERAREGLLPPEQVRTVEVEALVDTGATTLVLPAEVCRGLGLREAGRRKVRYANGVVAELPWVRGVWIEILGREMTSDALVEAEGTTPLIGQIPLEGLDLIVNPKTRDLEVNPASPDAPLLDLLRAS